MFHVQTRRAYKSPIEAQLARQIPPDAVDGIAQMRVPEPADEIVDMLLLVLLIEFIGILSYQRFTGFPHGSFHDLPDSFILNIDKENDALYFRLDESAIVESEEIQPGIILDYNAENRVVGIEILSLSTRVAPEQLCVFHFETS